MEQSRSISDRIDRSVYITENLEKFKTINGNRDIKNSHVRFS